MPTKTRSKPRAARTTVPIPVVTTDDGTVVGPGQDGDFHYDTSRGPLTLPSLARLERTLDMVRAINRRDEAAIAIGFIDAAAGQQGDVLGAQTLAVTGPLTFTELNEVFLAWGKFSGITPGNSPAS